MSTTTNYGWSKPTDGGDENTWGVELNTLFDAIDSEVHTVQVATAAAQSDADSLDTRVTAIEGNTPYGYGFVAGIYIWGRTCRGLNTGTLTNTNTVFVPFDGLGTFTKLVFRGSIPTSTTMYVGVYDTDTDGKPSDLLGSASIANFTGVTITGDHALSLTPRAGIPDVTLTRNSWLCISTGGTLETRGTTGSPPSDWVLGTASMSPSSSTDVISYVTDSRTGSAGLSDPANGSLGVTWTAQSGFAPAIALQV